MRKILISFLGTGTGQQTPGQYRTANYKIDNAEYETTFVAKALHDHFNIDHTIMFGTGKSIWDEFYDVFSQGESLESLRDELFDMQLDADNTTDLAQVKAKISQIDAHQSNISTECIKYGLNPEELQYNLARIVNAIKSVVKSGDQIYLDITHSFRSIPAFATPIVNYLVDILTEEISIKGIFYGMLDAKRDLGHVPIVNLDSTLELNMWMKAANTFAKHNNFSEISELLGNSSLDKTAQCLVTSIGVNSVSDVRKYSIEFISKWNRLSQGEDADISQLVYMDLISSTILRYPNKVNTIKQDWELLLYIAEEKWNSGQTVGAITCAWEAAISRLAKTLNVEDYISNNYIELSKIIKNRNNYRNISGLNDFHLLIQEISDFRNRMVHADDGKSREKINVLELMEDFPVMLRKLKKMLRTADFDHINRKSFSNLKYELYHA